MQTLKLSKEYLTVIKTIIKQLIPTCEVWAYGSRVNGNCHTASDLDLVVRQEGALEKPSKDIALLKEAFRNSELPILVDVMDWAYLPETYRNEIKKRYVVIQSGKIPPGKEFSINVS